MKCVIIKAVKLPRVCAFCVQQLVVVYFILVL